MSGEFTPVMEQIVAAACRDSRPETELAPQHRCLSPSDFGFHNALLRGRPGVPGARDWVFLDFEYFGWDDPAKTVPIFCSTRAWI